MLRYLLSVVSVVALMPLTVADSTSAQDGVIERFKPATAATARASASVERSLAVDTTGHTAIPNVQSGNENNLSFIRFVNGSGAPAEFEVMVVGGTSGEEYAPEHFYAITVPNHASVQRGISEMRTFILNQGGPDIAPRGVDRDVTLFVRSDQSGNNVGFQHVTFNTVTGYFENLSICTYSSILDYSPMNRTLINVHTTRLVGYPSRIRLTNPDDVARVARARIFDAATGAAVGTFIMNLPANGSEGGEFRVFESRAGFSPSASQLHVNLEFETADAMPFTALPGLVVEQTSSGADHNFTLSCGIN